MTNDFVALLKDSSLVSVLTVVELTKQTQIFATNLGSWVRARRALRGAVPGDVAAALAPGAPARGALEGADRMSAVLDGRGGLRLHARHARRCCAASTSTSRAGELVALMGLSGSGKTTILRAIAGLEPFDAGIIDGSVRWRLSCAATPSCGQGRHGVPVPLPVRAPDGAART